LLLQIDKMVGEECAHQQIDRSDYRAVIPSRLAA
jgi:hypothetical protein